mmetsp:Transcript_13917/g.33771  ORF Transcript_13917/g.33771 Transcript_13917/m.33771 type:complete len:200 (-) Transcript_13917:214-813(-)
MAAERIESTGQMKKNSAETSTAALGRKASRRAGARRAKATADADTPTQRGRTALVRSAAASICSDSAATCSALAPTSLPPATATLPTYSKVSPSAAEMAARDGIMTSATFSANRAGEPNERAVSAVRRKISDSVSLRFWPARKSSSSRSPLRRVRDASTLRSSRSLFATMLCARLTIIRSAATAIDWRAGGDSCCSRAS